MHNKLEIVKGLPKSPLYAGTDEYDPGIVELIDLISGEQGFAAALDGWQPQLPQPKPGVWSETAIDAGRQLVQQEDQNVIETLTIHLTASSAQDYAVKARRLHRLMEDTRDFHQTNRQISPVYLCHQFTGEVGPRYALIYSMQIAQDVAVEPTFNRELTVTIEREPYWWPVPPGSNPKIWTLVSQGLTPGTGENHYDSDDLNLFDNQATVSGTVTNQRAWSEAAGVYTETSRNYIDIPAEKIPGDAPAVMLVAFEEPEVEPFPFGAVYVAADSEPVEAQNDAGDPIYRVLDFFRVNDTPPADKNVNRGRFAVLMRANITGDVEVQLKIGNQLGLRRDLLAPAALAGNQVFYMGTVNVPDRSDVRAQIDGTGYKVRADNTTQSLDISFEVGSVDYYDILLMPVEQGLAFVPGNSGILNTQEKSVLDGTRYFTAAYPEDFTAFINDDNFEGQILPSSVRGQMPRLVPGKNNRVYFLWSTRPGGQFLRSEETDTLNVYINVVPRWRGMRDV